MSELLNVRSSRQYYSYSRRAIDTECPLEAKRLGEQGIRRINNNTRLRRSGLRLVVQSDAVFILSYNEHRPWNIIEGQRRMMTKGYEVSRECHLRRRAFITKGNRERPGINKRGYHTMC